MKSTVALDFQSVQRPASASPYYVNRSGEVVGPERYEPVERVVVEREFTSELDADDLHCFDLAPHLNEMARQHQVDAFVNVHTEMTEATLAPTSDKALARFLGASTAFIGALMIGVHIESKQGGGKEISVVPGVVTIGLGLAILWPAYSGGEDSTVKVKVEADAVRLSAAEAAVLQQHSAGTARADEERKQHVADKGGQRGDGEQAGWTSTTTDADPETGCAALRARRDRAKRRRNNRDLPTLKNAP